MKAKKIPRNIALYTFTLGSSLILGFLSFTGMFSIFPILPLAIGAFALSVSYEGEVYLQNIKGAFDKLFKANYLQNYLAKEYLLEHFPNPEEDENCPQFFKDYASILKNLKPYQGKKLTAKSKAEKKKLEKHLKDMEQWFAAELFKRNKKAKSAYAQELQNWLAKHEQNKWQDLFKKRQSQSKIIKIFSAISGLVMGLGSTYLIVEAFSAIPFFVAIPFTFWPLIIVPLAIISGVAYSLLTLNAVTEMVNNNTLIKWYKKLKEDLKQGLTLKNTFMLVSSVLLFLIAALLTLCTAGTWWTIASNARPLFDWMKKIPSLAMGLINFLVICSSSFVFISQNTAESLEVIDGALQSDNFFKRIGSAIKNSFKRLYQTENWLQMLNPFRILIKLTITPLRILLFLGHLASIAVTTDRMPGVSQIVAFIAALVSEGVEDLHYFNLVPPKNTAQGQAKKSTKILVQEHLEGQEHHDQEMDIPTKIINLLATPLYFLAACWDALASRFNKNSNSEAKVISLSHAWNKQRGIEEKQEVVSPNIEKNKLQSWNFELADFLINKQITRLENTTADPLLAKNKIRELQKLNQEVTKASESKNHEELVRVLNQANRPVYNDQRLFPFNKCTQTTRAVQDLPQRAILSF